MILADKIINERKKNGWSQEELAEKLSVSRQSISRWEGAQAVPDLQKILKMAEVFGVTTDYLLKDELEPDALEYESSYEADTSKEENLRTVSLDEADGFLNTSQNTASTISFGVFLCIFSPAPLICLTGFAEKYLFAPNIASAIGLVALIVMIAVAVFMFIISGIKLSKYNYIEKEVFETAYGVDGMVKEKQKNYSQSCFFRIPLGVTVIILSVIPLFLENLTPYLTTDVCVSIMLIMIAVGVEIIVKTCIILDSFKKLLQKEMFSADAKKRKAVLEPVSSIFWLIILFVYLGSSFITFKWGQTWIIWPIAGVLYAIINKILNIRANKNG